MVLTNAFISQAIHEKIMSLGFNDCKVFVSSVDSQSSANGGIVIQVLGEMSNKDGPWRKFAQTFFLAEQPNGYFVLNDIFRYLKEEEETEQEAQEIHEALVQETTEAEQEGRMVHHQVDLTAPLQAESSKPTPPAPSAQSQAAIEERPVEAKTAEAPPAESAEPKRTQQMEHANIKANGSSRATLDVSAPSAETETIPPVAPQQEMAAGQDTTAEARKATQAPAQAASTPAPAPAASSAPSPAPQASQAASNKPAAPKTWANLAASNAGKWAGVAMEGRGASATVKPVTQERPTAPPASAPSSANAAPARAASAAPIGNAASRGPHRGDDDASVFIKNVSADRVKSESLKRALGQFGNLLNLHMIPQKACAFADYASADDANRAINASVENSGLTIDGWKVSVESKRRHDNRINGPSGARTPGGGGPERGGPGSGGAGFRGAAATRGKAKAQ